MLRVEIRPMLRRTLVSLFLAWCVSAVGALAADPPSIYFSDVASAPAGSFVVIRGRDFGAQGTATQVRFGTTAAASIFSWTSTKIVAVVPSVVGALTVWSALDARHV